MKEFIKNLLVVVVGAAILFGAYYYMSNRQINNPISPTPNPSPVPPTSGGSMTGENATDFPLKVPDNFRIEVFAKNLPGARVMAFDNFGNMWVTRTSAGVITNLQIENGKVTAQNDVFRNLDRPHGLVFDPQNAGIMYYAEESKVTKVATYSEDKGQKIADLPPSGGHFTRTLGFGPDDRLYVSIGSSCNVCDESDPRRASIYSMNKDGSDFKQFAKGLRNTVFFAWSYVDGSMWGTDMGRDNLGDNVPPDEINVLKEGGNYGWPICYGNNVHDTNFDKKTYIRNPCMEPFETPAKVELQAHSAPLGLAFVPEEGWPENMWYDLVVAYHGSWNRSEPTGYKLVQVKIDPKGNVEGVQDFITGWQRGTNPYGRPVDVLIQPGGTMYVSDDEAGVIYKITYNGPRP